MTEKARVVGMTEKARVVGQHVVPNGAKRRRDLVLTPFFSG